MKKSLRVLVVEDEALIAMDIEALITDEGNEVVAEAVSFSEVEQLDISLKPDLAFVDMHLADGSLGLDVSQLIQGRWPETVIVYVTANPRKIPKDFGGAHGVIAKPFSHAGFKAALTYLNEGVSDPPPVSPQPSSFIASPAFASNWEKH